LHSEHESQSHTTVLRQKYFAVLISMVVVGLMVLATVFLTFSELAVESSPESKIEEMQTPTNPGEIGELVTPPSYRFETFSESGLASFSPSDGASFTVGDEIDFVLEFSSEATGIVQLPLVELYRVGDSESLGSCGDNVELKVTNERERVFSASCEASVAGDYVARAVWLVGVSGESPESSRHTVTALFSVRSPEKVSAPPASASGAGGIEIEFLGGGWGAWNHGQYYSVNGSSVVRSWCLRSAPGIAWRDENNRAVVLNPDGSIGETLASTSNAGPCVISGSVNGMEDGDTGELRTISVPVSSLLPKLSPEGCLVVRFIPGSTSFEPAWDDLCVRRR